MHEPRPAAGGSALEHPPVGSRLAFYVEQLKAERAVTSELWEINDAWFAEPIRAQLLRDGISEPFPASLQELISFKCAYIHALLAIQYEQCYANDTKRGRRGPPLFVRQLILGAYYDAIEADEHASHASHCGTVARRFSQGLLPYSDDAVSAHAVHRAMASMDPAFYDGQVVRNHKRVSFFARLGPIGSYIAVAERWRLARWDAEYRAEAAGDRRAGSANLIRSRSTATL